MKPPHPYHTSVLLHEAIAGLHIKPNGVYVDATFGGGGHSLAILEQLNAQGKLFAFDQDKDAWANMPKDARLIAIHENFRYLKRFLRLHGIEKVDGILADLGVSSHHFDTAARGFSTRYDGPLDMRMDDRFEQSAATLLASKGEQELQQLFSQYGEVRNAKQLAKHIVQYRNTQNLKSTQALLALIAPVVKGPAHKYHAQVFQALRIAVNDELSALEDLLQQAKDCVATGGRLCIITFHSLEDRLVKQFMKSGKAEQDVMKGNKNIPDWKIITAKPLLPTDEEQKQNPRSRSAKLRIAEKL